MEHTPFQVELSGIIQILSDHLYSQKEVFIRELLQNSVDAIQARTKKEAIDPEIRIEYFENPEKSGFIISDNGIGLNEDQIIAFLAKIGSSSKSASKFDEMRTDFIGQFGIGILSCFMVTDDIVVITKSSASEKTLKWTGNINGTYAITPVNQDMTTGTKVILTLREDSFIEKESILSQIQKYGAYLPTPIHLEINSIPQGIINTNFPWEKEEKGDEVLRLGAQVFYEDFTNYILLKDPKTNTTQGVLYIMPRPMHSVAQHEGALYVKKMFVTNNCSDILPDWAFFIKPIINTNQLSLTASREQIYINEDAEALKEHIGQTIKDYFIALGTTAPQRLQKIIQTHSIALKQIALADEHFLKFIYKWFTFPTTHGQMTLEAITSSTATVFYVPDVDEFRQIVPVAKANGKLVINSGYIYDTAILRKMNQLEHHIDYIEIDASYFGGFLGEITLDDHEFYSPRLTMLQSYMDGYDCTIVLKSFEPNNLPTIYHADIELLKSRDLQDIKEQSTEDWAAITDGIQGETEHVSYATLYLNINNKIVRAFLNKPSIHDKAIIETLYTNAMLMGHYSLDTYRLDAMNENFNILIQLALTLNDPL